MLSHVPDSDVSVEVAPPHDPSTTVFISGREEYMHDTIVSKSKDEGFKNDVVNDSKEGPEKAYPTETETL